MLHLHFSLFLVLDIKEKDISLFEDFRKGNKKAFDKIFYNYYESLCNFAFLFLKNSPKSEEVVADVFLNLWNKKQAIIITTSLKAYLYRSTRNAAISDLRKEKNIHLINEENGNQKKIKLDLSPETLLIRKEICDNFRDLIDLMPKQAALIFRLHKVDGMSYREIAQLLDLSIKTVENHMGRALKLMREMYAKNPQLFKE